MSPTPARTSRAAIVTAARSILEAEGLEAVTMATVAARVGVRPPSLYKHVRHHAALLAAIATDAADELARVFTEAGANRDDLPEARIVALADSYRAFARRSPRAAAIIFADLGPGTRAPVEAGARAARPVIDAAAAIVGPADALAAARVLTAFAYGFTTMEGAGAFRLGGSVDDAFRLGVMTLVEGLQAAGRGSTQAGGATGRTTR